MRYMMMMMMIIIILIESNFVINIRKSATTANACTYIKKTTGLKLLYQCFVPALTFTSDFKCLSDIITCILTTQRMREIGHYKNFHRHWTD